MEVQASTTKKGPDGKTVKDKSTKVNYPLLDVKTTSDLVNNFGEYVVFNAANSAIVISLQSLVRRLLDKGTVQADIQKAVSAWKPDVRSMVKMSAFEKAQSTIKTLSPEERKKLLAELTGAK